MFKKSVFFTLLLLAGLQILRAQQPKIRTTPLAGTQILSEVDDPFNVRVMGIEAPETDGAADEARLKKVKEENARRFPRVQGKSAANKRTSTVPMPLLGANFVADSQSGIPPDNYVAINDSSHLTCMMNSLLTVHDGVSGSFLYRKGFAIFARNAGLNNSLFDFKYDPKIIYDPEAKRFIIIMLSGTDGHNYIVAAFSQTDNPAGGWNFYKFYGNYDGDTTWFDYPAISITHNDLFLTGNKLSYSSSWQTGFKKSVIYQIKKQDGYNGDTALHYQIWDSLKYDGNYIRCLHPLKPGAGITGPSQIFLSVRDFATLNDSIFIIKVEDTLGAPGNHVSVSAITSSTSYGIPPNARQVDTNFTLATNDNRVLGGFIQGNEIQFVLNSIAPTSGGSGIYHGVISNYPAAPVATGHIITVDSLDFGYPNISYAGDTGTRNRSIISFEYSGPRTYAGLDALFYDGYNYSDILTIQRGSSSIHVLTQREQRWGDYSGSQPKWDALGTVWVDGIFAKRNNDYGCYVAELKAPYRTGIQQPTKHNTISNLYPNPALRNISLEFELPEAQGVHLYIFDITGAQVADLGEHHGYEGKNLLEINIASLPSGTYLVKGTGTANGNFSTAKFVKQ